MPHTVKISSPKSGHKDVEFSIDLGTSLDDAVSKFGAEIVYNKFCSQCVTDAGNAARAALNGNTKKDGTVIPGLAPDKVIAEMASWKPGLRQAADPVGVIAGKLSKLDPEARKAAVEELLKRLGAA